MYKFIYPYIIFYNYFGVFVVLYIYIFTKTKGITVQLVKMNLIQEFQTVFDHEILS